MKEKRYLTNKKKYINEYNHANYIQVNIRIKNDDDLVINKLNSVKSKNAYILGLIRKDINKATK